MKQPVVRSFLGAALVGMSVLVSHAATYYWAGGDSWNLYSNPDNWRSGSADGDVAPSCPGAADSLGKLPWKNMLFDLGGGVGEFGTWDTTADWNAAHLSVSNGTLTAKTLFQTHSGSLNIWDGGTFVAEGRMNLSVNDATRFNVNVHKGGTVEVQGAFEAFYTGFYIDAGGLLKFSPTKINLWGNNRPIDFELNGTMEAPAGIRWTEGNQQSLNFNLNDGGRMVLGGNVSKTVNGSLCFNWNGGTIATTGDVVFENTVATIPENAALVAEVAEGTTLDLSPFTVGEGVSLNKTGAGILRLGSSKFANLSIESGTLAVGTMFSANMATFAEGTTVALSSANASIEFPEIVGSGLTLKFAANGILINNLPSAFSNVEFDLSTAIMDIPYLSCLDESSLETIRMKLAAVLPDTQELTVQGVSLVISEKKDQTFTGGADGTITDWNDPSGWSAGVVPTSGEVAVQGGGVVLELATTPTVNKIEVSRGAKVRVVGGADAVVLPTISLAGAAGLEVASGSADIANGLTSIASVVGASVTLPTIFVNENAMLKVLGGTKFKNCSMTINGKIVATSDGEIVFGAADSGEVSYFELTAEGATITALNTAGKENGSRIGFVVPVSGGSVVVPKPIRIKDSTITYNSKDGFAIGLNNPASEAVKVIVDNTALDFGAETYVAGGVNLILTNGTVLCRKRSSEGDTAESNYNLRIQNRAVITLVEGGEIRTAVTRVNGDVTNGAVYVTPDETGFTGIEILKGGVGCWYKLNGQDKGSIRFADGFFDCFKSRWWGWGNRNHLFNRLTAVEIAEGTTMTFRGVEEKMSSNDHKLDYFELEAPFTGGGNLFFTNTWAGKTMEPTIYRADNTCTGTLLVAPDSDTAKVRVHFANGANWAGTVVFNGNVDMLPVDENHKKETESVMTATFGKVRLVKPLELRIWRGEDKVATNDTITLKDGFIVEEGDAGIVELVPQDGFALGAGEAVTLGTFPAGAFANVTVKLGKRKLSVREYPTETEGVVTVKAKPASGFRIIIR